jgi:hypothetical protein
MKEQQRLFIYWRRKLPINDTITGLLHDFSKKNHAAATTSFHLLAAEAADE